MSSPLLIINNGYIFINNYSSCNSQHIGLGRVDLYDDLERRIFTLIMKKIFI
jgi:hypothetical protein